MAKMTMVFGVALAVLGGAYFAGTGSVHSTALIPFWFGLVLLVCGMLANTEDAKKRMVWMHIAVTVGLLGLIGVGARAGIVLSRTKGEPLSPVTAVALQEQGLMALICAVFVGMCVRSFIAARRGREASGSRQG